VEEDVGSISSLTFERYKVGLKDLKKKVKEVMSSTSPLTKLTTNICRKKKNKTRTKFSLTQRNFTDMVRTDDLINYTHSIEIPRAFMRKAYSYAVSSH